MLVTIGDIFGTIQLVSDYKFEDGKLFIGGHSIIKDKYGVIIKVTETTWNCVMETV
jgi:hypothetical protein